MFMSIKDHFLLAMPELNGSPFQNAVIYICQHSEEGAMGLTINQPLDICLGEVFDDMELSGYPERIAQQPLLCGGPVETEKGFVLHKRTRTPWQTTLNISSTVSLTTSRDIIEAIARDQGPERCYITLGYSGWAPGQLEKEIAENAWLTTPADPAIIFNTPFEKRASATAAMLGIDLNCLGPQAGHA
jgi:putative transcriptional regulator